MPPGSGLAEWAADRPDERLPLDLCRTLLDTTDPDVVARTVCAVLAAELGPARLHLFLCDDATGSVDLITADRPAWALGDVRRLPQDAHLPVLQVVTTGVAFVSDGARLAADYPLAVPAGGSERAGVIILPLRRSGAVLGAACWELTELPSLSWDLHALLESVAAAVTLWCCAWRADAGAGRRSDRSPAPPLFTRRQRRVLTLARLGLTNAQIAGQLGFSEQTIKADLTRLYRAFGARDRRELLERATEAGL